MDFNRILVFDGAMGTILQENGLPPGACPEAFNLNRQDILKKVHQEYVDKGADIITTNTFGGNRVKLAQYNLEDKTKEINMYGAKVAKEIAGHSSLVAGSVGPTGLFVEPLGELSFSDAYNIFQEQIKGLIAGGVDLILLETFNDLGEMRAALLAAKDITSLPVICSLTFTNGRTLTGVSPGSAAVILESMGADVIGANCSGGPQELLPVIKEFCKISSRPIIVQPNAGLPVFKNNKVTYPLDAQLFLKEMEVFFQLGLNIIGSCCGSTPEHTQALKERAKGLVPKKQQEMEYSALASREEVVWLGRNSLPKLIGERINPTARKKIANSLLEGDLAIIQDEAKMQVEHGAHLLDINVGAYGVNEKKSMIEIINLLQKNIATPLVIDSTDPEVIQVALEKFQGKALVNSVNGEKESLEKILPLVKRFGAGVIGLTLDDKGIPEDALGRFAIAKKIVKACLEQEIPKKDIYIDCLVLTIGTSEKSALETLKAIKLVKEKLQVNTVLGVSNISHGLPNRGKLNSTFLAMAIASGLDLAIINPLDQLMLDTWQGASFLAGRDFKGSNYLHYNAKIKEEIKIPSDQEKPSLELIKRQIINGLNSALKTIEKLLEAGTSPLDIINKGLIPGLNIVGEKFGEGEYYLPQLMLSAEISQKAFALLEKKMSDQMIFENKGTVVLGTVKGDIHDIGKNIVGVMLKNHGFQVLDLGKNVSKEEFLKASLENRAHFVGLSALMTTTMQYIPETIEFLKKKLPHIKIIIGGAVINENFAIDVKADGYAKDAVEAVKVLENLKGGNL